MEKYKLGYAQGVFDMFHVGHLNLLNRAKEFCDYLVVGVNSDKLVMSYKNKTPVIDENARRTIVANIKSVDEAFVSNTLNKIIHHSKIHFDVIFIGDDWQGSERWTTTEKELALIGVDLVYLPYTHGISSTQLRPISQQRIKE